MRRGEQGVTWLVYLAVFLKEVYEPVRHTLFMRILAEMAPLRKGGQYSRLVAGEMAELTPNRFPGAAVAASRFSASVSLRLEGILRIFFHAEMAVCCLLAWRFSFWEAGPVNDRRREDEGPDLVPSASFCCCCSCFVTWL